MNKQDVINYFDSRASLWDEEMIRNEQVIKEILDHSNIREGLHILDVACGTGVLFPDYLARNVASLTAIDISPEMTKIAQAKFPEITVICGDVTTEKFTQSFDVIMVYNAFPHFSAPEQLIQTLTALLRPGGRLTIAHGMSREKLLQHHSGSASKVSIPLMHEDELANLLSRYLTVDVKISDHEKYILSGTLN